MQEMPASATDSPMRFCYMTQIKIKEIEHEATAMTGRNFQRVCVTPCSVLTGITSSVGCETFQ